MLSPHTNYWNTIGKNKHPGRLADRCHILLERLWELCSFIPGADLPSWNSSVFRKKYTRKAASPGLQITDLMTILHYPQTWLTLELQRKYLKNTFKLWVNCPHLYTLTVYTWDSGSQPVGCISDIYITVHNTSKATVTKSQQNNFMVGVTTTRGTALKGHSARKVETTALRDSKWLVGAG